MFDENEYVSVNNASCKWKCVKCGAEFEDHRSGLTGTFRSGSQFPLCPICYPPISGASNLEHELGDFLKSIYNGAVFENVRNVISPFELDIYLPDKNLAIEFDGLYWHSEACGKDEMYHLEKTEKCRAKGIRLVHVFEDEWICHREIVEDRIKSILGIGQERVFARQCAVCSLNSDECNKFLDENHLQGGDNSSIRYGLYYNGELVSAMTFGKPRFDRKHDWEMIRFASRIGLHVVGGASKLLAQFSKLNSGSIVSYADRRYSDGNLYEKLGFRLEGVSKPNYWYVKKNEKLSRYACQKHKLTALLGDGFNPEMSEYENMSMNGWTRLYDCGNLVYSL